MSESTPNIPMLRKAIEWVEAEAAKPYEVREWEQNFYRTPPDLFRFGGLDSKAPECGTCYCVAGFVDALVNGGATPWCGIHESAQQVLGLSDDDANGLFAGYNTAGQCRDIAEEIAGERL